MHNRFLLIDKPVDWTSNDVTVYIRSRVAKDIRAENPHIKYVRVGHAGTLDPFATGLLIVGVGRQATRKIDELKGLPKTYEAVLQLGATSDTYDCTGMIEVRGMSAAGRLTESQILKVLHSFVGKQSQIPPMHSAKKVNGKRLYKLARKGVEIERKPCDIEIFSLELVEFTGQLLTVNCHVSTGTYIRTLAHDIGQKLGVGAYCRELRRTAIGSYSVNDAVDVKEITEDNWMEYVVEIGEW